MSSDMEHAGAFFFKIVLRFVHCVHVVQSRRGFNWGRDILYFCFHVFDVVFVVPRRWWQETQIVRHFVVFSCVLLLFVFFQHFWHWAKTMGLWHKFSFFVCMFWICFQTIETLRVAEFSSCFYHWCFEQLFCNFWAQGSFVRSSGRLHLCCNFIARIVKFRVQHFDVLSHLLCVPVRLFFLCGLVPICGVCISIQPIN